MYDTIIRLRGRPAAVRNSSNSSWTRRSAFMPPGVSKSMWRERSAVTRSFFDSRSSNEARSRRAAMCGGSRTNRGVSGSSIERRYHDFTIAGRALLPERARARAGTMRPCFNFDPTASAATATSRPRATSRASAASSARSASSASRTGSQACVRTAAADSCPGRSGRRASSRPTRHRRSGSPGPTRPACDPHGEDRCHSYATARSQSRLITALARTEPAHRCDAHHICIRRRIRSRPPGQKWARARCSVRRLLTVTGPRWPVTGVVFDEEDQ